MRHLTYILVIAIVALMAFGCATNPQAIPAAIEAAAIVLVVSDPAVCDEVPFDAIRASLDHTSEINDEYDALCTALGTEEPPLME